MHSWRIGLGLLLYLYLYLTWSEQKQRAKRPTVFYSDLRVHPEVGVRIPSLSSSFSPFPLPIGAPFPNITLPKRKRIISYLFNGFTIEQRIHQSFFLSMHMKRIEPTYLLN